MKAIGANLKKYISFLTLFCVLLLVSCSGGGNGCSSPSGYGSPIQIGSLPNGSAVYLSENNLPVSDDTAAQATIYLVGGSPNESYNVHFAITKKNNSRQEVKSSNPFGIDVATTPNPCVIGSAGSGAPQQCQVTITSSADTYDGTYLITPTAIPVSDSGAATILSPLTILVSGPITPSTKAITEFLLNGTPGTITGTEIAVVVPYGTDVTSLVATYLTTGKLVSVDNQPQINGVTPNNFSSPVTYTVTAEDGSTQNYTVTVTVAQNSAKAITAFSLDGTNGVISGNNIAVTMPYGTNVTALIATFTTSGQSVKVSSTAQTSGVTPNNFSSPVTYTVTAEDGSTQNYTVTVTVAPQPSVSLLPTAVINDTSMNYTNNGGTSKTINSIVTNSSNVKVAVNGDFCTGQTIETNSSCNFVLSAMNLPTPTSVVVTINYSGGGSSQFTVTASSTNTANFGLNNARYLLVRYIWGNGDFDIGAGFQSLTPAVGDFPIFTTPPSTACVGYDCGNNNAVSYNAQTLVSWAGDNTTGGEEDVLIDLWLMPTGTTNFNFGVWGNWYDELGNPITMTVTFETYANGTTFSQGSNQNFIPSTSFLASGSSAVNVTWYGWEDSAQSLSNQGLICTYTNPVVTGQANNGSCDFVGK